VTLDPQRAASGAGTKLRPAPGLRRKELVALTGRPEHDAVRLLAILDEFPTGSRSHGRTE
jgi:hypothetical protein